MTYELLYILNDFTRIYSFCRIHLVAETKTLGTNVINSPLSSISLVCFQKYLSLSFYLESCKIIYLVECLFYNYQRYVHKCPILNFFFHQSQILNPFHPIKFKLLLNIRYLFIYAWLFL